MDLLLFEKDLILCKCVFEGRLQSWNIEVLGSSWLFDSDIAHVHL